MNCCCRDAEIGPYAADAPSDSSSARFSASVRVFSVSTAATEAPRRSMLTNSVPQNFAKAAGSATLFFASSVSVAPAFMPQRPKSVVAVTTTRTLWVSVVRAVDALMPDFALASR